MIKLLNTWNDVKSFLSVHNAAVDEAMGRTGAGTTPILEIVKKLETSSLPKLIGVLSTLSGTVASDIEGVSAILRTFGLGDVLSAPHVSRLLAGVGDPGDTLIDVLSSLSVEKMSRMLLPAIPGTNTQEDDDKPVFTRCECGALNPTGDQHELMICESCNAIL